MAKVKVMAEICAGWLWIDGDNASIEDLVTPTPEAMALNTEFEAWVDQYENKVTPAEPSPELNWDRWHSRGIELTREFRKMLPPEHELRFVYGYGDPAAFGGRDDLLIQKESNDG